MDDPALRDLRDHLLYLLKGGGAHIAFDRALKSIPAESRGKRPRNLPYSLWELLEHMRIAQWDILEFSRDAGHKSPQWPAGYWPDAAAPPSAAAWTRSIRAFKHDMDAMCALVANPATDLFAKLPHGDGQTILREALLIADHNAYHLGQFVLVRRLLGCWQE